MTGIVKTDQLQGAQGTTVTIPTGNTLAVTSNATVGGTLAVTSNATVGGNINLPTANTFLLGAGHNVIQVDSTRTYLYGGTNGVQFRSADNSTVLGAINNLGQMTKPLQAAFMAQPASTQSNLAVAGSGVNIDLGTERFDVGGDFANNTFTAPVTGKYALNALFYMNAVDSGTTYYEFTIKTSNRVYGLVVYVGAGGSVDHAYATWSSSVIADMDASDTAYLHYYQAGGTQQTDVSTGTYFMGYLLG